MKTWTEITLEQFRHIIEMLEVQDEYTTLNLLDYIYSIDSANMTLQELSEYNGALEFLNEEMPTVELKKQYTLNGHTYNSNVDITSVTAAQFIDYQNYVKEEHPKYEKILSVFFIPENHQYNDGYSISEVQTDLLQLDIATVQSVAFFMSKQFQLFLSLFQFYLAQSIQKMKMPKKQKRLLLNQLRNQDLSSLELFRISQSIAKKQ